MKIKAPFVTPWEYETFIECQGKTFIVWKCKHQDGDFAYQFTQQPVGNQIPQPPQGNGSYSQEGYAIQSKWMLAGCPDLTLMQQEKFNKDAIETTNHVTTRK